MKSDSDWREKYLDTLDKLEQSQAHAAQAKQLESVLRLLAGRLCLAAQGRDARLDKELRRIGDRVRAHADAPEIQSMVDPLSRAIAALDDEDERSEANAPGRGKAALPERAAAGEQSLDERNKAAAQADAAHVRSGTTHEQAHAAKAHGDVASEHARSNQVRDEVASEQPRAARDSSADSDLARPAQARSDAGIGSDLERTTLSAARDGVPATPRESDTTGRIRAMMSAAVKVTLDKLSRLPDLRPALDGLQEKAPSQVSADDFAVALQNLAGLIGEQRSRLQREKLEVEGLLTQMNARLEEIATHLAGDMAQQRVARDSSAQLNSLVMGEVHEITTTVQRASDLGELRKQVSGRLDAISAHFQDFRAREEERARLQIDRAERMRARITELEKESHMLQETLKHEQRSAMIDALTGIPNRAAYDDRITQEFEHWRRSNVPLCILAWDIDHFKAINDQYGHKAGDKVLRIIGQHLAQNVRGTDFVARYGGEEFVMLLTETSLEQAMLVAEKIRQGIAALGFHFRNMPVTVTASCGVTTCRTNDTIDGVFERADRALYQAKDEGRNRCVMD
jgi:diguanylate cyclase